MDTNLISHARINVFIIVLGLFISAIFFSEPTVTSFILEKWHKLMNHSVSNTGEDPPHLLQELSSSTAVEGI